MTATLFFVTNIVVLYNAYNREPQTWFCVIRQISRISKSGVFKGGISPSGLSPLALYADYPFIIRSYAIYIGQEKPPDGSTPYIVDNIYYHNGYLYYMKYESGMSVLVRMDTAGNNREDIAKIMPSGQDASTHLVFHGDYAYAYCEYTHYTLDEEYTEIIKRISLKDGSTNNIYEVSGKNITVADVKSYGNRLYFAVQEQVEKRSYNSKTRGLYAYDYDTEKVSLVSDEDISDYCMIGDKNIFAYYVVGQGLYYSDINEQTTQLVIKADKIYDRCNLSYDGNYVYMDNILYQIRTNSRADFDKRCMVLTADGSKVNEISCQNISTLYYGDSRCMFALSEDGNDQYAYIDKKDIENADKWVKFYAK